MASPAEQTNQRGLGLSGSIHEEAHLSLSLVAQSILEGAELVAPTICWSSMFHLLTTLLEKNTSNSPECTSFYFIIAYDLLFPYYSYPV